MNNQNIDNLLPIGTIILLKNGTKRIMINGYCVIGDEEENKVYDYSGVLFPEGMLNSEQNLVFNHNQITRIDYLGLSDQEQKDFIQKLKETLKNRKGN